MLWDVSIMFISLNWSGSIPMAVARCPITVSMAAIPLKREQFSKL